MHRPGAFTAAAAVRTEVTAPAITEFLGELAGIAGDRPVTPKELEFCQKVLSRGYPSGFATSKEIATQLRTLATYHLPDDYFNTVVPAIKKVTCGDVTRMAKKYFRPEALLVVVVGDREQIEPQLRKLPIGKQMQVLQFDDDFHLVPVK